MLCLLSYCRRFGRRHENSPVAIENEPQPRNSRTDTSSWRVTSMREHTRRNSRTLLHTSQLNGNLVLHKSRSSLCNSFFAFPLNQCGLKFALADHRVDQEITKQRKIIQSSTKVSLTSHGRCCFCSYLLHVPLHSRMHINFVPVVSCPVYNLRLVISIDTSRVL